MKPFPIPFRLWAALLSPLMVLAFSCGNEEPERTVESIPVCEQIAGNFDPATASGLLDGNFITVEAAAFEPNFFDNSEYTVTLFTENVVDPCAVTAADLTRQIEFDVGTTTGEYELNHNYEDENKSRLVIARDTSGATSQETQMAVGRIVVDLIGNTSMNGKIAACADQENFINGNFQATRCD